MATIDDIAIARPCSALWSEMRGDDRARFCGLCRKTVYDSAGLDECELERMLAAPTPPCVRVHRDAAGRVLTRDRIAAAALAFAVGCTGGGDTGDTASAGVVPTGTVAAQVDAASDHEVALPASDAAATLPATSIPEASVVPHATMGEPAPVADTGSPPILMGRAHRSDEPKMGKIAMPTE
jgi:hypothetical protein